MAVMGIAIKMFDVGQKAFLSLIQRRNLELPGSFLFNVVLDIHVQHHFQNFRLMAEQVTSWSVFQKSGLGF